MERNRWARRAARGRVGLGIAVLLLLPAALTGQSALDVRWEPWLGCWEPAVLRTAESPAEGGAAVCIYPAERGDGVRLITLGTDGSRREDGLRADGVRERFEEGECRGWRTLRWSADGQRIFLESDVTCRGAEPQRVAGVRFLAPGPEWVELRRLSVNGEPVIVTRRYVPAAEESYEDPAAARWIAELAGGAREDAARPLDAEDVAEAYREVGTELTAALIRAQGLGFEPEGDALDDLRLAGVPLELMRQIAGGTGRTSDFALGWDADRYDYDGAVGGTSWGRTGRRDVVVIVHDWRWDPWLHDRLGWYDWRHELWLRRQWSNPYIHPVVPVRHYLPRYPYWWDRYRDRPPVVIVRPAPDRPDRTRPDRAQPRPTTDGRAVPGRGYTVDRDGRRTAQPRAAPATTASPGRATTRSSGTARPRAEPAASTPARTATAKPKSEKPAATNRGYTRGTARPQASPTARATTTKPHEAAPARAQGASSTKTERAASPKTERAASTKAERTSSTKTERTSSTKTERTASPNGSVRATVRTAKPRS